MQQEVNLYQAFEKMRTTLRGANVSIKWRHDMLAKLEQIFNVALEFGDAKKFEQQALDDGEKLHKDHPNLKRFSGFPKRKAGFVDPLHNVEYQLTNQTNDFFNALQNSPLNPQDLQNAMECYRLVLEGLDDQGVFLGQRKNFAAKETLGQEYDDRKPRPDILPDNRVSEFFRQRDHLRDPEATSGQHANKPLLFQRLNQEQSREKKR